ncbi:hypothetical protein [Nonomuraea sp. NPDC049480]|uniref:hypothetical protein n=1 Tax=Nonomuraea sp. NPDC049480 TaxID=3364353 RepID=UPI0037B9C0F7
MSRRQTSRREATGFTQAEEDVAEVMIWLRCNHGREVGYADIAAGVQIPDGHRRNGVPLVNGASGRLPRPTPKTCVRHSRHLWPLRLLFLTSQGPDRPGSGSIGTTMNCPEQDEVEVDGRRSDVMGQRSGLGS